MLLAPPAHLWRMLMRGVSPEEVARVAFGLTPPADGSAQVILHSHVGPMCPLRWPLRPLISSVGQLLGAFAKAQRIVFLIGAGASTGPDFRSPGGLYDQIAAAHVLSDPTDVFDIAMFRRNPSVFWSFAHLFFPAERPLYSGTHRFIAELSAQGRLHRLYTQNVDCLEFGVSAAQLRCLHGSWRSGRCVVCQAPYDLEWFRPYVEARTVPRCACGGLVRPGIVFFSEAVSLERRDQQAIREADLFVVVGTSLRVSPANMLPGFCQCPTVLVNREPVGRSFDAEVYGRADDVFGIIGRELGFALPANAMDMVFHAPNRFTVGDDDVGFIDTSRATFVVRPSQAGVDEFL